MKKFTALLMVFALGFIITACGEKADYSVTEKYKPGVYDGDFEIRANVYDYDFNPDETGENPIKLRENATLATVMGYKEGSEKTECIGFIMYVDAEPGVDVFYNRAGEINVTLEKENNGYTKINLHNSRGYITHTKEITEKTDLAYSRVLDDNGNINSLRVREKDSNNEIILMENGELK